MMKKHVFNSNKYCNNCGKHGHAQHECVLPIISIGVILYKIINGEVKYLMIRRKESFGYCDYVKNKSKNYNRTFLSNVIDEMTDCEKQFIKNKYDDILTQELLEKSTTSWCEPEWGFPKGRRNNGEKDLECGLREFQEETGFSVDDITLIENINPYEELFIGSNLKSYKQKYYLAYTESEYCENMTNYQKTEVSKIGWFSIEECNEIIRSYNCEKLRLINNIHETITNFESVNFTSKVI